MPLDNLYTTVKPQSETQRVSKEVSNLQERLTSGGQQEPPQSRGILYNILETLARSGYAASNVVQEFTNTQSGSTPGQFDPLSAAWRGLTLQEQTTGKDIMKGVGVSEKPLFKANIGPLTISPSPAGILGFATDVVNPLDPINWLTFGMGKPALQSGRLGAKHLEKAFGPKTARALTDTLGEEALQFSRKQAPTVGKLVESVMGLAEKRGIKEGVNPLDLSQWLSEGMQEVGSKAGDRLVPNLRRSLRANIQAPIANRALGGVDIPGSDKLLDLLSSVGKRVGSSPLGEAAGRAFSTKFVPQTVPESVWTRFMRGLAPKGEPDIGPPVGDLSKAEKPLSTGIEQVSGPEVYGEVKRGLARMMEKSRVTEQRFMKSVEQMFKGLTPDQRKQVMQGVIYPEKVTPDIAPTVEAFKQWQKNIVETYHRLGVDFTPMETYVPFIATGKVLSKDELAMLKGLFGTGIHRAQTSDIVEMISKYDPNLITRATKAADPSEVNRVLGREWLTEDAAVAMSRRGIRAIRGEEAATFLNGLTQKYGLTLEDVGSLKELPLGYVVVAPKPESTGRIALEATQELSGKAIALPQEFVKAYNEYTDLLFNTAATTAFGHFWDNATRIYKTMAYMWNPGHIPRDLGSNLYNLWLMGMRSPKPLMEATASLYKPETTLQFAKWSGTGKELQTLTEDLGLLDSGSVLAEFLQSGDELSFTFGGKYTEAMRKATRATDNFSRLAGFIDRMSKGDTPEQAVAQVKKYLFDYFDLTPFEKRWMKRVIPFYTWIRKNIPLQIETVMTQPGKYAATYEAMRDIGEIPESADVPDFILKSGGFKLPGNQGGTYVIPNMPFSDLGNIPQGLEGIRELSSMINPMIRAPIEVLTNTALYSGQPLERYAGELQKLPLAELIQALTGMELPQIPARTAGYALEQIPPLRNLSVIANPEHPRQGARLASILGGPQIYPQDWAKGAATYEERDKLRALIRYLEGLGTQVPTIREVQKKKSSGRGGGLSSLYSR